MFKLVPLFLIFVVPLSFAGDQRESCPAAIAPKTFHAWLTQSISGQTLPATRRELPVLVVGAGPAGLVQIKKLRDAGIQVEGVERHSDLGGLWNKSHPLSPAYDSLKMDSSRFTSHFGQPGEKKNWPDYFDRETAFRFLHEFATQHALKDKFRFSLAVTKVDKEASGAWKVSFSDGSDRLYRAVIIATGKYNRETAVVPETFRAQAEAAGVRWLHASEYRNPEQSKLVGERVLIIGASNSAVDIAKELADFAEEIWLSVRSTRWFVPEYVFGIPADDFAGNGPKLPHWLEMPIFNLLQRVLTGHPRWFGFPDPDHGLLEKLPVPDRGILRAVRKRKVLIRPNIAKIDTDGSVHFVPSTKPSDAAVSPTVIVFATGYRHSFPFLSAPFQADPEKLPLFSFHPTERGLFFLIEPTVPEGSWPSFAETAETVAAFLKAEENGNEEVLALFDGARLTAPPDYKGYLFHAADGFHADPERLRNLHKDARAFFRQTSSPLHD